MNKSISFLLGCLMIIAFQSCSKKVHPTATPAELPKERNPDTSQVMAKPDTLALRKADTVAITKPAVKKKSKEPAPAVIVVNDKYAKKSVDGRYYYDLQGHRYWRSNKDGKYYLFNKSMLGDEDFKKKD
jgi:hypothetical protein